jgi:hypothetical protein
MSDSKTAGSPFKISPSTSATSTVGMSTGVSSAMSKTDYEPMWKVLKWTIISATLLMVVALVIQKFDHTMANATKDVLPLATALVGFASGAVTAIFGRSIQEGK